MLRASTRTLFSPPEGGTVRRTVIPGGLRVVTESIPGALSATVGVWVGVGSRDETPSQAGSAHYLEHLLFKGTRTRSALDIAVQMDAVGGELNAFTAKEHTCFYANVLGSDLPMAIELVGDVVLNATMRSADIDNERQVVLEEIAMRDDDPADLVHEMFSQAVLGDSALGRSILGSVERIDAINRAQILSFYKKHYCAPNMVVSVAGKLDHSKVLAQVREVFASVLDSDRRPNPTRRPVPIDSITPKHRIMTDRRNSEQAHLVLGMRSLDRFDDRRFALLILEAALGGGMSSRLFQEIREKRGLAYTVYAYSLMFAEDGLFGVYAGCAPSKVKQVIAIIQDELANVAAHGLRPDEVSRAIGLVRGSLVLGLEDTGSRMTRLGQSELSYGNHRDVPWLIEKISSVTVEEVAALATDLLSREQSLSVVGPFSKHAFDTALGKTPTLGG